MRRLATLAALAVLAALAAAPAHAKPGHELLVQSIDVAGPTARLDAGEPWTTTVTIASAHPRAAAAELRRSGDVLVTLVDAEAGISRIVTATPTGDPLVWRARIEFPQGGVWAIGAHALMTDAAPTTVWVAPAGQEDATTPTVAAPAAGTTPWVALAAAAAASLLIGGALLAARRGRPHPV